MILPSAPAQYGQNEQAGVRRILETADKQNRKKTEDVEVAKQRLILTSPDGTRFNITVSNTGTISATSL